MGEPQGLRDPQLSGGGFLVRRRGRREHEFEQELWGCGGHERVGYAFGHGACVSTLFEQKAGVCLESV